jgi:hypothetical protein
VSGENCIEKAVICLHRGHGERNFGFKISFLFFLLSESEVQRLRPHAERVGERFVFNSDKRFVDECVYYAACPAFEAHPPEAPVRNVDDFFIDRGRRGEAIAEIVFWLNVEPGLAEVALQNPVRFFKGDGAAALGALVFNLHGSR